MFGDLHEIVAFCGAHPEAALMLPAMFLAGLTGGVVHCAPMCGPFVLGQVAGNMARVPGTRLCELSRLRSALLLPYHAGRLLTYAALGATAGAFAGIILRLQWMPALVLFLAGVMFASSALARVLPGLRRLTIARKPGNWSSRLARLGGRVNRSKWSGGLVLGLVLGFLPCGMLYAALMAAAASGSAVTGAAAMLAFGLGTVPALLAVGVAGQLARRVAGSWRRSGFAHAAGTAILMGNAGLLWLLAARLLWGSWSA